MEDRPTIVCLCGSTRFYEQFMEANYKETLKGNIVLSVGFFMHRSAEAHRQHEPSISDSDKRRLDDLHLRKIDLADEVLVINVNDYIGLSTKREVWYAWRNSKRIRMWEMPTRHTTDVIRNWFATSIDWQAAAHDASTTGGQQELSRGASRR